MSFDSSTNPIIIEYGRTRQRGGANYFARAMFMMMIGLLVTAATSYLCISSGFVLSVIGAFVQHRFLSMLAVTFLYGLINLSITRSVVDKNASASAVNIAFYCHAVLEGLMISPLVYFSTGTNVATAFCSSSALFAFLAMSSLKSDGNNLLSLGRIVSCACSALFVAVIMNLFFMSETISLVISCAFIVVCSVAVVYDVQWMKMLFEKCDDDAKQSNKFATMAAMMLHSNIVNLFWHILYVLGHFSRKRD